jgi:phospholipid-translocating ATPase
MVFRGCSIGGKIYEGDGQPDDESQLRPKPADAPSHQDRAEHISESEQLPFSGAKSSSDHTAAPNAPPANPSVPHFHDAQLQRDLHSSASEGSVYARTMNAFLTTLALCHTVLAATDGNGALQYTAQSPDEAALVQAAADCGFIFRGKDKEIMKLQTPFTVGDSVEEYELLHVLDFTSARKRMSVIVRKVGDGTQNDNRIFLLCKGADSIIFERLRDGPSDVRAATERHLEYFASSGMSRFR